MWQRLFPSCHTVAAPTVIEPTLIKRDDVIDYPVSLLEPRPINRYHLPSQSAPPPSPSIAPQKDDPGILLETLTPTVVLDDKKVFPEYIDLCLFIIILCLMVYMMTIGAQLTY